MKNVLGDLQALRGADLVLFSSEGYFPSLMTARAADNGIWLVAASGDPANVWDSAGHQGGEESHYRGPRQLAPRIGAGARARSLHENSSRGVNCSAFGTQYLDNISNEEITELNIPTACPLV